jgi:hypothetical protein
LDFGFWILDFGFWIWDLGFGIWDLGFGIWDSKTPPPAAFFSTMSKGDLCRAALTSQYLL